VTTPVVRVVGLGPAGADLMTIRSRDLLAHAPVARLRTRVHPAALDFAHVPSYDDLYERAASFEELYQRIVDDLVALAAAAPGAEVVYAVPGSPVVAERTVELLVARGDVRTVCEPAVSVIDLACGALGRDPMAAGLRVLDALEGTEALRGPGPLLVLQAYSPEVLATVADRLAPTTPVLVLHHLGLDDEEVVELAARDLITFTRADHLTSLWVEGLRTAGEATDDLLDLMRRLRRECPWDQEQTHASLTRHLLEEAYEALDALEALVREEGTGEVSGAVLDHVEEELGDLLFQIVFHAELGDEEGRFSFATIADTVRDKLIGRHPHVFGDVVVSGSDEVATRWEALKRAEKGRDSVTDGIAWQLPGLTLYTKLLRKAALVGPEPLSGSAALEEAREALARLVAPDAAASDAASSSDADAAWGDVLVALAAAARAAGVDLEGVVRARAMDLRESIRDAEARGASDASR
jgi:tetrapyrrole methylase family protein / MazG family protein